MLKMKLDDNGENLEEMFFHYIPDNRDFEQDVHDNLHIQRSRFRPRKFF